LLIENKCDLVSEDILKNDTEIKDFSKKNKFIGVFRTSAKIGINVSESMEYLIKTIIERLEDNSKNNKFIEKDSRSIVLENKTFNKRKENCC
jgi:translation initiation factor 2 gamma subunit (eIF-2gamma)